VRVILEWCLIESFTDVLGYSINEIKTEQRIQGRRADYILSVGNSGEIVVEAKLV